MQSRTETCGSTIGVIWGTRPARARAVVFGCLFALLVAAASRAAAAQAPGAGGAGNGPAADDSDLKIKWSAATGWASFVSAADGGAIRLGSVPAGRAATAGDFLQERGRLFGVLNWKTELRPDGAWLDDRGYTHTSFQQVHRGVDVFAGKLRVHQDGTGAVRAANGDFFPIPNALGVTPAFDKAHAIELARNALGAGALGPETANLVVVDPGWYGDIPAGAHLAYYIILADPAAGLREAFFIDANHGKVLDQWSLLHSAMDRLVLDNNSSAVLRVEGGPATGIFDEDAAYDYSADTYTFLANAFGRDGIDDAGITFTSRVHRTSSCPNAAYHGGGVTTYCDGVVTDDIVAHEYAHGLTGFTAGLIYQHQPGQLNESFSDVFGEVVDLLNGDASSAGPPGGTPWPAHPTGPGTDTPNELRSGCSSSTLLTVNLPVDIAGGYAAQAASFGPALTLLGVTGDVVVADPPTACDSDLPFSNGGDMFGRIVLVDRGNNCPFVEKVRNAQDEGALAVIVANNVAGGPSPMGGTDGTIIISSVGIGQSDGVTIRNAVLTDTVNVTMHQNPGPAMRWLVGEDSSAFGGAIRDMWQPSCKGHPDTANHVFQTCSGNDVGGVHSGSGVPNHAFAMLTDGKSFNSYTVNGIGLFKASAVWYRALTVYLTPASDFEDAYAAFNQAAADLVAAIIKDPRDGSDYAVFTDGDADEVDQALLAVEMNTPGRCGDAQILNTAPASLCDSRTTVYGDDFESGINGWTVSNSAPPTVYDWVQVSGALPFGQPGTVWFAEDSSAGDCDTIFESGVHSLFSPTIPIPAGPLTSPTLTFTHYIGAETFYDGGNVKISIDMGPWQLIPRDAFTYNGYNSNLRTTGNDNPLAGEQAFTGVPLAGGGWGTSLIDLSAYVSGGEDVQFRFDFSKDCCCGIDGWYLDDFEVFTCPACVEDVDCDDADICTRDLCLPTGCINSDNIFGDVNHDGTVDIFDILCVLDGFSGVFAMCSAADVELAPCPDGDAVIDIFDILAVLDAFAGTNICNCPAGP